MATKNRCRYRHDLKLFLRICVVEVDSDIKDKIGTRAPDGLSLGESAAVEGLSSLNELTKKKNLEK